MVSSQIDTPAASPSAKNLCTHCTGGWVVPSPDLDDLQKRKALFPARIRTPDRPAYSLIAIPTFVYVTKKNISVPAGIRTLFLAV